MNNIQIFLSSQSEVPNPAEFSALSLPFFSMENSLGGGKKETLAFGEEGREGGGGERPGERRGGKKLSMP